MRGLDRSRPPAPAEIRPFDFPQARRGVLDNGLAVIAARHGRLPVVTAQIVVDAGAAREDELKAGLAHLTAHALDAGTSRHTGEQLAWEFEKLGVELGTDAGWDAVLIRVTLLATRLEPALALLAEVVREASFPDLEVQRLRGEQLAEILQRRKEPRALANDMAAHFIFGPDATYGRAVIGTTESVGGLGREDIVAFHRDYFTPAATSLVLVGDVEHEQALELATRYFGDWRGGPLPAESAIKPAPTRSAAVHVVDRPDAVQSEIRVGHVGVARRHRDYFPLIVMNAVLGGTFTSRLNLSLRERHGFTYAVRSGFVFRRAAGPFMIQTAVATEVTVRAVEEILREVQLMHEAGATEEEVDNARRYLSGVLPLELQTTDQLAARLADLVTFGLPEDYFESYPAHIAAVTTEEVARVAREQLAVGGLTIVVVGGADAIREGLEALDCGPVDCLVLDE